MTNNPSLILPVEYDGYVSSAFFSPDSKYIATVYKSGKLKMWNAASGEELYSIKKVGIYVLSYFFSPDSKFIIHKYEEGDKTHIHIRLIDSGYIFKSIEIEGSVKFNYSTSPKGRFLAASTGNHTYIWELSTGKIFQMIQHHLCETMRMTFSSDEKLLICKEHDTCDVRKARKCWVYHLLTNQIVLNVEYEEHPLRENNSGLTKLRAFDVSTDGSIIAVSHTDNSITLYEAYTGRIKYLLKRKFGFISQLYLSEDSKFLASVLDGQDVEIWKLSTQSVIQVIPTTQQAIEHIQFSTDSKALMVISSSSKVELHAQIWTNSGDNFFLAENCSLQFSRGYAFSPGLKYFVTDLYNQIPYEQMPKLWDLTTASFLFNIEDHDGYIGSISFSADAKKLVAASDDGTASVWDVQTGTKLHLLDAWTSPIDKVLFSDNKNIIATSDARKVSVWYLNSAKEILSVLANKEAISTFCLSKCGTYLAIGFAHGTVCVYDLATGKEKLKLKGHSKKVNTLDFSDDSHLLVTGSDDESAIVWDMSTGNPLYTAKQTWVVTALKFISSEKVAIISGESISVIDITIQKELNQGFLDEESPIYEINILEFSSDGRYLAIGDSYHIKIYDTTICKEIYMLDDLEGHVDALTFSRDSKHLIIIGFGNIFIWEIATKEIINTITANIHWATSLACSSDNYFLLAGTKDKCTEVWDLRHGRKLYTRLQFSGYEWLVYDEDYRFDGSEAALDQLYFMHDGEKIKFSTVKDKIVVPNLASKLIAGDSLDIYPKFGDLKVKGHSSCINGQKS